MASPATDTPRGANVRERSFVDAARRHGYNPPTCFPVGYELQPFSMQMKHPTLLEEHFKKAYPEAMPAFVCRAPGRVNLIGEHVDYNGLPVLPMTIDRDIRIACAPRNDCLVRLHNTDVRFAPAEFLNQATIPPSPVGSWANYCKAAVQKLNAHFRTTWFPGMDLLVSGDIPIGAGLSSSSALVVASALAYLPVLRKQLGKDISRMELAGLLAEAEHYVGTQGGGMDQAVILLGKENAACKIDFFPLRVEEAPLFREATFIVCNSLVSAKKTGEAMSLYNQGPRLSRLICAMVERQARKDFGEEITLERLGDLWYGPLCLTNEEVAELFDRVFPKDLTPVCEIAHVLEMTEQEVRTKWVNGLRERPGGFRLRARARHQLTEFARVESARDMLLANDPAGFGALMNASHESCANDYEVSCPELDRLASMAREHGALGARLTGAGFGGCTVNLVPAEQVEPFCRRIERAYYRDYLGARFAPHPDDRTLVARASPGAGYPAAPALP